jgi:DNA replication protein DnaC
VLRSAELRRILEARGIDPDADFEPEPPFDPIAYRRDLYGKQLAKEIPGEFTGVEITDRRVEAWLRDHLRDPATASAIVLSGDTGAGKTHNAYALIGHIVMAAANRNQRCRWKVVTHPDLNAEMRPKPDESHAYALDAYLEADLLVFDDLGAGKHTEYTTESAMRLVDRRWANRMPTIYTTNLTPDLLDAVVGERVTSRLSDATTVVLPARDHRYRGEVHDA